jgi:hypothetical protein
MSRIVIVMKHIGYGIHTAVVTNIAIFWDTDKCSPYVNQHFGGMYHLHFHGKISQEINQYVAGGKAISQPAMIPVIWGLEGKRKGTVPTLIGLLLFLKWLTKQTNVK